MRPTTCSQSQTTKGKRKMPAGSTHKCRRERYYTPWQSNKNPHGEAAGELCGYSGYVIPFWFVLYHRLIMSGLELDSGCCCLCGQISRVRIELKADTAQPAHQVGEGDGYGNNATQHTANGKDKGDCHRDAF